MSFEPDINLGEMLYSPKDIAKIICMRDMSSKQSADLTKKIWKYERAFLSVDDYDNEKNFVQDVNRFVSGNYDKKDKVADVEYANQMGFDIKKEDYITDFRDVNVYFKDIRLQYLFYGKRDIVWRTLRPLLEMYGLQRRSVQFNKFLRECLIYYHLKCTKIDGSACNLEKVGLDEQLSFVVV
ncbi:MAG: hypothetical protein J6U13_00435 [Salinivirgaceae bacterium]|nr:hypothetical protein [Salinivirgaceae bacterium]